MTSSPAKKSTLFGRHLAASILVLFLLTLAGSAVYWAQHNNLFTTTPSSKPYTELYFADTNKLPKTMRARDQRQFSFVVTNAEDKPMTYPYEVRLVTDSLDQVIASGSLQLNHKEASKRTIAFTAPQSTGQFTVIVKLKQSQQRIQFRVQGQ